MNKPKLCWRERGKKTGKKKNQKKKTEKTTCIAANTKCQKSGILSIKRGMQCTAKSIGLAAMIHFYKDTEALTLAISSFTWRTQRRRSEKERVWDRGVGVVRMEKKEGGREWGGRAEKKKEG